MFRNKQLNVYIEQVLHRDGNKGVGHYIGGPGLFRVHPQKCVTFVDGDGEKLILSNIYI